LSLRVTLLAVALRSRCVRRRPSRLPVLPRQSSCLALGAATEAITTVSAAFARRDSALNRAVAIVRDLTHSARPGSDSLRLLHDLAAVARTPLQVSTGAAIPHELGAALASIDGALSRVGNALEEGVVQLERGRRAEAAARLATVEQLLRVADERGADGSRVARGYLTERQRALRDAAGRCAATRSCGSGWARCWFHFGSGRKTAGMAPLREIEVGLTQVADGDLTVSVPVHGSDELGRLAEHSTR